MFTATPNAAKIALDKSSVVAVTWLAPALLLLLLLLLVVDDDSRNRAALLATMVALDMPDATGDTVGRNGGMHRSVTASVSAHIDVPFKYSQ